MKTLFIISAMLLALSSCTKECPAPDPTDNTSVYTDTSPDDGTNPDTGTNPDDGSDPDGGSTCPY